MDSDIIINATHLYDIIVSSDNAFRNIKTYALSDTDKLYLFKLKLSNLYIVLHINEFGDDTGEAFDNLMEAEKRFNKEIEEYNSDNM
jgi:hypothetical protein